MIKVNYNGKNEFFHAEYISGLILSNLKETAENFLNEGAADGNNLNLRKKVTEAVITVPAYFNDS